MKLDREDTERPHGSLRSTPQSLTLSDSALMSIVLLVFFLSGFSALAYQVVWAQMLTRTFGVTNYAVTTVLAAFMGGLALGSYVGGRVVDRRLDGLRLFGWLEIGLGVYALALPSLFEGLVPIYRSLYPILQGSPFLLTFVRFSLSALLLILPTTLMGATFPILVRALVGRREELGPKLARLYTWNTLGSVLGSVVTGAFLIGLLGLNATTSLAAILNIGVGVVTLFLVLLFPSTKNAIAEIPASPRRDSSSSPAPLGRVTLLAMFLAGFAGLGYEVVWTRVLTLLSDHAIYAFSSIVAIVLIGIAVGSIWTARLAQRGADPLTALIAAQLGLAVSAMLWFPANVLAVQALTGALDFQVHSNLFFSMALFVTLIPTLFMGISFPLGVRVYTRQVEHTGRQVGEVNSINVLGAMLGAAVAGFVLIPKIGAQRSLLLLALINVVAAASLSVTSRLRARALVSGGLAAVLVAALTFAPNTLYVSLFNSLFPTVRAVEVFESVEVSVAVAESQGIISVWTNGSHEADTSAKMLAIHQLIGYLPYFIHPAPEQALVVGVGGGATSGAIAQYAQGLTIVELSEGMVRAARLLADYNSHVLDNPKTRLIVGDGRNYVLLAGDQYDVIAADTIRPLRAYSSSLYSVDYYHLLANRLKPGGVMVQWVDSSLPEREQRVLMRTFLSAFPHAFLWQKADLKVLLGSNETILPRSELVTRRFTPDIAQNLVPQGVTVPEDILSGFVLSDDALRAEVGPGIIVSDDHPYNEYFWSFRIYDEYLRLFRLEGIWKWLEKRSVVGQTP